MPDPTPRRLTAAEIEALRQHCESELTHGAAGAASPADMLALLAERMALRQALRDAIVGLRVAKQSVAEAIVARAQALLEEA